MGAYEFNAQLEREQPGIDATIKYLKSLPETYRVKDVRKYRNYMMHDVDIVWYRIDGNKVTNEKIEVKCDYLQTGNFFLEILSNVDGNVPGCLMATAADSLFYYIEKWNALYRFEMRPLRKWMYENKEKYPCKDTHTCDRRGRIIYSSRGIVVPINDLLVMDFCEHLNE